MNSRILTYTLLLVGCGSQITEKTKEMPEYPENGFYGEPTDFTRAGCSDDAWGIDIEPGVYTMELDVAGHGTFPVAFRLGPNTEHGFSDALLAGDAMNEAWFDGYNLFLRAEWQEGDDQRVRAMNICGLNEAGDFVGEYVSCRDKDCIEGKVRAQHVEPAAGAGLSVASEFKGWQSNPLGVATSGDRIYVATESDGLFVLGRNAGQIVELGSFPPLGMLNDVEVLEDDGRDLIVVASDMAGAVILDVTDPQEIYEVSRLGGAAPGSLVDVHSVHVRQQTVYVANLSNQSFEIFDVSQPESPALLGQYVHPSTVENPRAFVHDFTLAGTRAYLSYWDIGIVVVDIADPSSLSLISQLRDYGGEVSHSSVYLQMHGKEVLVHTDEQYGGAITLIDVTESSPSYGEVLDRFQLGGGVSAHNVVAVDGELFVSHYQHGVRRLEIEEDFSLRETGAVQTWSPNMDGVGVSFFEGAIDLTIGDDGVLYATDSHRGLVAIDG